MKLKKTKKQIQQIHLHNKNKKIPTIQYLKKKSDIYFLGKKNSEISQENKFSTLMTH